MERKSTKLYNVIFPLWLLVLFPVTWLIVIPANILIDSLVICLSMKKFQVPEIKAAWKKLIVRVVCFGFLADMVGGIFMYASQCIPFPAFLEENHWIYFHFTSPVMYNPLESPLSILWVLIAMAISSVLIYFLNKKYTFRHVQAPPAVQKKLSLILAILTTPILFLIPTEWFW